MRRLKNLTDIRRYLARIINECESGNLDPTIFSKLAYGLNILSSVIKDDEFEGRVETIERILKIRGNNEKTNKR